MTWSTEFHLWRLRTAVVLLIALTLLVTLLFLVSAPRAHAALVGMNGGYAFEHNILEGQLNSIVVCDTKVDGFQIRGDARLSDGTVISRVDFDGGSGPCQESLPYRPEIVAIRVCRVGDACTTWRPS
jgi:hypothetical protein